MTQRDPAGVAATLLQHREAFKAFLVARVGSAADAEDLLQDGLVKALARSSEIREDEKAVAWFYQVLRNVLIDHLRSRQAANRRDDAWAGSQATLAEDPDAERQLCACFEKMLPAMKPAQAELLRRVELQGESVAHAAAALGLSANHASVTLHRARADLRKRLIDFCGECACLDDCGCD